MTRNLSILRGKKTEKNIAILLQSGYFYVRTNATTKQRKQ